LAIKLNTNKPEAYYNLGNVLCQMKNTEQAIVNFEKAVQLNPLNLPAQYNLGNCYFTIGKIKESV